MAHRTRHRLFTFGSAFLIALLLHAVTPRWLHGASRFVAAYDAGAITLLVNFWTHGLSGDADRTRARAALDDPGRNVILLVVLITVVVGLVSAIAIVGHGPQVQSLSERWVAYGLGVIAIFVGWLLVHTIYTFRYAHLYWYDDDGDGTICGGIRFPGTEEPSDWDFAYFSFCLGTSFAVSDPQVTETRVRREVIAHSIIAFVYNSVIIGMVINLFAGIFGASGGDSAAK
ncbi:MAG TPA: DUF1345 domain-containing protein [Candidatus Elarobacter sp.]|jgi:uncharacterized membrane protein|nr:DUF1345 domain-containing protein [Candidatus Elarobacter sp.]